MGIVYYPASGAWRYIARTSLDVVREGGRTELWLWATDGHPIAFLPPSRRSTADATMEWMSLLHMAHVFGLPYRIFVSVFGCLWSPSA